MSRKTCFDPSRSLHDRRFRRKLSGWEFKDFLFLLWFAADECRDPAFVPAHKVPDLAMELGMTGKDGRAKFAQRLAKWSAPGIELITLEADGGIQIDYVLDQDVEESAASAYEPPPTAAGNGHSPAGIAANGNGGSAANGNGNGSGYSVARRPRKNQSNTSGAEGKRYAYWQVKANTTGHVYVYDGITFTPAGQEASTQQEASNQEVSENSPKNLRPAESKPPVLTGELGEKDGEFSGENGQRIAENSLAGASRVTVVRESKDSLNSDHSTPTVPRDQNLQETSDGSGAKTSDEKPPAKTSDIPEKLPGSSDLSGPIRPLPRPEIKPHDRPAMCEADVKAVRELVGDGPEWRNQWVALWRHCCKHELLRCWDEGFAILVWRLRVSPMSGPGAIRKPSVFLRGTIWALLKDAAAPYVPASQANGSAGKSVEEPVDEVQLAEIRRSIQDVKERWDAEVEGGVGNVAALKEVFVGDIQDDAVTPLEDLYAEGEDE